jgi:uncharacterized membrane protein
MRLNLLLLLLLFVSFLPFTTAIAATHLFVSHLTFHQLTVVGVFLPLIAVVVYLAVSIFFIIDLLRHVRVRARRPAGIKVSAGG